MIAVMNKSHNTHKITYLQCILTFIMPQHCTMKFGSWTYDGTKLNLTLIDETSPKIDLSTYTESGEWIILG